MGQFLLVVVTAVTVGAIVFGVATLFTGKDSGLSPAEPDGAAAPLPMSRPLVETDITKTRFDVAMRGYRMDQVDHAMRRTAYDIGYKDELIHVLEAEVDALRDGRVSDADALRQAREAALANHKVPSGDVAVEVADVNAERDLTVDDAAVEGEITTESDAAAEADATSDAVGETSQGGNPVLPGRR